MTDAVVLTASQVDRLMACPAGGLLPRASDPSPAAEAGTSSHLTLLRPGGLSPEFLSWFRAGSPRYEAAFAWSPGGPGLLLGEGLGRSYPRVAPASVFGSADALAWSGSGRPRLDVADLKTGQAQVWGGALPAPEESWQLRTLAVLWWASLGFPPGAEVRRAWFLLDAEAGISRLWAAEKPASEDDLRGWAAALAGLLRRLASGEARPDFARGPWCLGCSSFDFCPAQRDVLSRMATADLSTEALDSLPDEALADLWLDAEANRLQAARAREAFLRLMIRRDRPLALPGGRRELVPAAALRRRVVDPEAVARRAAAEFGEEAGKAVVEVRASVRSVERGLRAVGRDGEGAAFLEALEDEALVLKERGAPRLKSRRASGAGG